jgi:hypothetical protein
MFKCTQGQCVSNSSRCNRTVECLDMSDEEGCSCVDMLKKMEPGKICDCKIDCPYGADETGALCNYNETTKTRCCRLVCEATFG